MKIISYTFNAIMPLIFLIFAGYLLNRKQLLSDTFIKEASRLVFRLLLPCQLFLNIYQVRGLTDIRWDAVLFANAGILAAFLIGICFANVFITDPKQKGVVAQAFFRSNVAIIGVPLGQALGGAASLALIAVVSSCTVAELNILGVIILTIFLPSDSVSGKHEGFLKNILKNPLIRSLIAGMAVLFVRMFIPAGQDGAAVFTIEKNLPFLYKTVSFFAQATTPLALISMGGQFRFSAIGRLKKQIFCSVFGCNFFMPGVVLGTAMLLCRLGILNFGPEVFAALLPVFASPVAFSSAIMAREMNNDGELAAQIVVWSNIVSIFSLFFWIALLLKLGYLSFLT